MAKQPPQSDNIDDELFQQEIGSVKRLTHNQADVDRARNVVPSSPTRGSVDNAVEFGESLTFLRSGIQTSSLQKLKRGQYRIEATLDLHGLTANEANLQLQHFMQNTQMRGMQAVRIIHGKGHGSEGLQSVLKSKINQWLREFTAVLAFTSAHPRNGGTGAVDVLLRK